MNSVGRGFFVCNRGVWLLSDKETRPRRSGIRHPNNTIINFEVFRALNSPFFVKMKVLWKTLPVASLAFRVQADN